MGVWFNVSIAQSYHFKQTLVLRRRCFQGTAKAYELSF